MINFHIISLFPESMKGYLSESILKRAQKNGIISVSFYNPMDYTEPSKKGSLNKRVDDKPYGGGPGMVIRAEPIIRAVQDAVGRKRKVLFVHFTPRGDQFSTSQAKEIAAQYLDSNIKDIVFICGRYEGVDSRINEIYPGIEVSIGDYVLTGGELPALVMIDSISRQLPGVLGDSDSREEERISAGKYYTRPEVITHKKNTYEVPPVLLSGNHKDIDTWRKEN